MTAGETAGGRWSRLDGRARREVLIVLALLFCYGFFRQVPVWNENSRYDLVRALVEDGTTRIDRFHQNTGDKALYQGHFYSDKPPGTALMGVPVYLLLTGIYRVAGAETPDPETAVQALAFVECGILTALLVVLLMRFLRPVVGEGWALMIGLGYALGSIAFPFATMFFGHAASSFLLFAAFYLLWRWRRDRRAWRPLLAGLLAGWAVVTEFPAALGVAVLAVYALWLGRRTALRFVLGGIPAALVLMAYNWITFGGPLSIGYQYATTFGEQNSQGLISIVWPSLTTTVDLLVGPRGLVRLAPWFALAPLGLLAVRRRRIGTEVLVAAAICVLFLTYNSGALNPFGGWTPGPRYLLPALPFAAVLVALAPRLLRPIIALLIAVSAVVFFVATVTMPNAPELYRDPLVELWLPRFLSRDIAQTIAWLRWGLHGIQPVVVVVVLLGVVALTLAASFRERGVGAHLMGALAAALALALVAFSLPFWPADPVRLDLPGSPPGSIAIVDAGVTPIRTGDRSRASIWAQLDNGGPPVEGTRVVFTVFLPDSERLTWNASYGDVSWRRGERKRLVVEWDIKGVAAGDYPVNVRVESETLPVVYASLDGAGVVRVGR